MTESMFQVIMEDYEDKCLPRDKKLIIVFYLDEEGNRSVYDLILGDDEKSVKTRFRRKHRSHPDMKRIKIENRTNIK